MRQTRVPDREAFARRRELNGTSALAVLSVAFAAHRAPPPSPVAKRPHGLSSPRKVEAPLTRVNSERNAARTRRDRVGIPERRALLPRMVQQFDQRPERRDFTAPRRPRTLSPRTASRYDRLVAYTFQPWQVSLAKTSSALKLNGLHTGGSYRDAGPLASLTPLPSPSILSRCSPESR